MIISASMLTLFSLFRYSSSLDLGFDLSGGSGAGSTLVATNIGSTTTSATSSGSPASTASVGGRYPDGSTLPGERGHELLDDGARETFAEHGVVLRFRLLARLFFLAIQEE